MWEAVFADMGVALAAILNSTRVLRGEPDKKEHMAPQAINAG